MEEAVAVERSNVVELRPGTSPQVDREREFVEFMVQKLKDYREMGVTVDSLMMCFVGTAPGEGPDDPPDHNWLSVTRFIGDDRNVPATLAFMAMFVQKYVSDGFSFSD